MAYIPRKDLVKAVTVAIDSAKRESAGLNEQNTPPALALIAAVEALLELVENDFKK